MRVFGDAVELVGFQPVSEKQFARAHHPDFVKGVLNQTIANGFGNRDAKVAQSLPYTSESLLAAAHHAIQHREVAVSGGRKHT